MGRIISIQHKKSHMALFLRMAKYVAMWPAWREDFWFLIWYYSTVSFIFFFEAMVTITLFIKIFTSLEDVDGIATVIDFATVMASGVFRWGYSWWRGAAIKNIIDSMDSTFLDQSLNPFGPQLTIDGIKLNGKRLCFVYFFGSMIWILTMVFIPLSLLAISPPGSPIKLIFEAWMPIDLNVPLYRNLTFAMQAAAWTLMGYYYLLMDAFWYMVLFLTIGQMKLLRHSYRNLVPIEIDGDEEEWPSYADKILTRSIQQHQMMRRFIQDLESILNPIIIVDFMHAVLSITFLLLDTTIALHKQDWAKIIYLSEYLIISIVHMFCYDWLGNELALEEAKLGEAIYDIPWYRAPKLLKTRLILAISASRKPCRLTGGKFYYLSLEFFVEAMRSIFSYFMVLVQLRESGERR